MDILVVIHSYLLTGEQSFTYNTYAIRMHIINKLNYMSKYQTIKTIRSEIDRLNREIDLCIIKGIPYARQALRHKILRTQLSRMISGNKMSMFGSLVSAFLF
ncbi:MAG: hypothetical protein WCK03_01375 [Candidatus Taylorbacteria bacterium]